jgi:hypothetical protein
MKHCLTPFKNGHYQKDKITSAGEDMERRGCLHTVGRNVNDSALKPLSM